MCVQIYDLWTQIRETQLKQELERIDRFNREEKIKAMQHEMGEREKRLWFFENQDAIDIKLEAINQGLAHANQKHRKVRTSAKDKQLDDAYVPPEVDAKRN